MKNQMIKKIALASFLLFFALSASFSQSKNQNPLNLYNQGLEFEGEENWFDAGQAFFQVVSLNPSYSDAWFHLASCSYKLGEFELALSYLEKAAVLEKNNSKIQNLKGLLYLALGRADEAKEIFNQVLKDFPNDVNAHFGLAELELYEGKFSGAEQQYSQALRRQVDNRKALLSLALICAETGRFGQSEKFLNQAMQLYSGESEVHFLASLINFMKGDISKAEKHVRICIELNKNFVMGYQLLAAILYTQGKYTKPIEGSWYKR